MGFGGMLHELLESLRVRENENNGLLTGHVTDQIDHEERQ